MQSPLQQLLQAAQAACDLRQVAAAQSLSEEAEAFAAAADAGQQAVNRTPLLPDVLQILLESRVQVRHRRRRWLPPPPPVVSAAAAFTLGTALACVHASH